MHKGVEMTHGCRTSSALVLSCLNCLSSGKYGSQKLIESYCCLFCGLHDSHSGYLDYNEPDQISSHLCIDTLVPDEVSEEVRQPCPHLN